MLARTASPLSTTRRRPPGVGFSRRPRWWGLRRAAELGAVRALFTTWVATDDVVVLDTETTGLDPRADQVIELAIVGAASGEVLWQGRLRPTTPMGEHAEEVHGISVADLAGAPTWADAHNEIDAVLAGRTVVAYNCAFDRRMIEHTARAHGLAPPGVAQWVCAMEAYAVRHGQRRRRTLRFWLHPQWWPNAVRRWRRRRTVLGRGRYRRVSLEAAARAEGLEFDAATLHGALADTQLLHGLLRAVAGD